jgi:serine/threonine protein kinase
LFAQIRTLNYFISDLLWKAPELLRGVNPSLKVSQKGDVYSFGIILYEIIGRKGPYGLCPYEPKGTNK